MSYTDLRDKILIALYQEQVIFGQQDIVFLLNLANKYGLSWQEGWLLTAQKDLDSEGLITGPGGARNDGMAGGKITGAGMRQIEGQYGSKEGVGIVLKPVTSFSDVHSSDHGQLASEPTLTSNPPTVNSKAWTGTQHILIDQVVINDAKTHAQELKQLVYTIHIPNNAHSSDLKALVELLIQVLDMCEPEVTLIDRILASPKFKLYTKLAGAISMVRGAIGI